MIKREGKKRIIEGGEVFGGIAEEINHEVIAHEVIAFPLGEISLGDGEGDVSPFFQGIEIGVVSSRIRQIIGDVFGSCTSVIGLGIGGLNFQDAIIGGSGGDFKIDISSSINRSDLIAAFACVIEGDGEVIGGSEF